jgi:hypothetical protein
MYMRASNVYVVSDRQNRCIGRALVVASEALVGYDL